MTQLSVPISSLRFPFVTELVDREKYGRNVPKEVIISEVALDSMNKSKIDSNFLWKINDIFKISYFQKWVYIFRDNTIDYPWYVSGEDIFEIHHWFCWGCVQRVDEEEQ